MQPLVLTLPAGACRSLPIYFRRRCPHQTCPAHRCQPARDARCAEDAL